MTWELAFQTLIGLVAAASAIYATRAARKGAQRDALQKEIALQIHKDTEERKAEAADRTQAFAELTASLAAARLDLAYYAEQLIIARREAREADTEKAALQQEWVGRNERLLARCQALATQLETILTGPLALPVDQKARIRQAVGDMARHIRDDHEHYDDGGN